MKMGVVADDVTGSNDIGIMFAKSGCLTHVYEYTKTGDFPGVSQPELQIVILDTNSRLDPPEVAYRKVFSATHDLYEAGFRQFFKKTCSVFRGNIGVEFDAMLDALGQDFAVVILGFPKNGRTTVDGIHYVHGKRLEDSEFRTDPIHPMTRSNIVDILQSQTKRKVSLIPHAIVDQGAVVVRKAVQRMRSECQYVILDVTDQAALTTIAESVYDEPVLCGSSALAEELPAVWGLPPAVEQALGIPYYEGLGILCSAGSLMPQTAEQIDYLRKLGSPCFILDTLRVFDPVERTAETIRLVRAITAQLKAGTDVIFHSPNDPAGVEATRRAGAVHGYSNTDVSRLVSETIAEVSARVLVSTGQNRLVAAGGETATAVCTRLGVRGMRIWKEIQPGLPSCVTLSDPPRLLVLKSGSFGKPDFFEQALLHLRQ